MACYNCKKNNQTSDELFNPNRQYKTCSHKMETCDWMSEMPQVAEDGAKQYAEIRFKNGRKEFYFNINNLKVEVGDIVAVEASPGHDIGIVSLVGEMAYIQMKYKNIQLTPETEKKLYRKAKPADIEKWKKCTEIEDYTKTKSRQIIKRLNLQMKLTDVEYQGDGTKAIFYYSADDRVDFRELIKILAEEFKIRIEMKQIGVRQESSRLGGVGSCGRELCCSTWLSSFKSVSTNTARTQQLSLNPQKLAGQCAKLKCCLNYEQDIYIDSLKKFPDSSIVLKTMKGDAFHRKNEIFKDISYYSYFNAPEAMVELTLEQVLTIIDMNKSNKKPEDLAFGQGEEKVKISNKQLSEFDENANPEDIKKLEGNY
ncbi:MAG: regulatory iron-sulfur-containing complex subunit RicT [Bacteroidota bacterium]